MTAKTPASRVLLVLALAVSVCLPEAARAQEKKNLRIAFVSLSWNNQLPFRTAISNGYFKDQNLAVEPIFVRGGPVAIAALVSGNVDFASIGGAQAAIRSRARGIDVRIIASQSNYTNYTLLGGKGVRRVEDLKGKIIGITGAGSFSDFVIRVFLRRNHLDPDKDVVLRGVGGTAVRAIAMENGQIAAAPFTAEDAVRLIDKGYPMIVNLNQALRIPQSIFITRGDMLEKTPDTSRRFLKAVIQGMQFASHHKAEAIKIGFAAGLKGEPDVVSRSYDLFRPGYATDLAVAYDGIQTILEEDIRAGVVDKQFTLERVVDDRLLKQAQAELRAEGKLKP